MIMMIMAGTADLQFKVGSEPWCCRSRNNLLQLFLRIFFHSKNGRRLVILGSKCLKENVGTRQKRQQDG
jgi:hypothetical protein